MATPDNEKALRDAAWEALRPSQSLSAEAKSAQTELAWGQHTDEPEHFELFVMPKPGRQTRPVSKSSFRRDR